MAAAAAAAVAGRAADATFGSKEALQLSRVMTEDNAAGSRSDAGKIVDRFLEMGSEAAAAVINALWSARRWYSRKEQANFEESVRLTMVKDAAAAAASIGDGCVEPLL